MKILVYLALFVLGEAVFAGVSFEQSKQLQKAVDTDKDGKSNFDDNCPGIFNPDQKDSDKDGIGDLCEPKSTQEYSISQDSK